MNPARRGLRARHRRGQAAVELVFAFPLLIALLSVIFAVASVSLARSHSTIAARNEAFSGRHEPWRHGARRLPLSETRLAGVILGPRPRQPADGGLVSARDRRQVEVLFGAMKNTLPDVSTEHSVLGGSWDHKEIEFERHRPLFMTPKAAYFGFASVAAFAALAGL